MSNRQTSTFRMSGMYMMKAKHLITISALALGAVGLSSCDTATGQGAGWGAATGAVIGAAATGNVRGAATGVGSFRVLTGVGAGAVATAVGVFVFAGSLVGLAL